MNDRLDSIESRLDRIEQRLAALEGADSQFVPTEEPETAPLVKAGALSNVSTLTGRVLLVLGGAYLLRAITDAQVLPLVLGILSGAAYAIFWLYVAFRKGSATETRTEAVVFGAISVLLFLPLIVEASTRFALLTGAQATIATGVFCTVSLAVAAARELRILGWIVIGGGIFAAFAVLSSARSPVAAPVLLLYLGLASLWIVYVRQWHGMQWLGATGAVAAVAVLAILGHSENWPVQPLGAFAAAVTLLVSYLASFAIATHRLGRRVGVFEAWFGIVAAIVVLLTASTATRAGQLDLADIGLPALLLGVLTYSLALTHDTRAARGLNFNFYSMLGLGLVVAGTAFALPPMMTAVTWSLLACLAAWSSGRFSRVSLSLQCTLLLLAAGAASGLFAAGTHAFVGDVLVDWPGFSASHVIVAAATVACLFIPVAHYSERWGIMAGAPQLIVLVLSVWLVGGLLVIYTAPFLADAGTEDADLAIVATIRTAVLSAASVTLALSSRFARWPEARWLVYPVLFVVGLKLVFEDFPNGKPITLFISLGLVGSALLLVARLLRRDASD